MKPPARAALLVGAALLFPGWWAAARAEAPAFDYYVLSLSWSPQYCASQGGRSDALQCAGERRYGFVLHGLWPQYARGGWPDSCIVPAPPLSAAIIASMLPIQPAEGLIRHEWARHGTCSGMDAGRYFETASRAYRSIAIPAAYRDPGRYLATSPARLTADFAAANPGLTAEAITAVCAKQYLVELRLCLGKDLKPARCGAGLRSQCGETVVLRPAR